MLKLFLAGRPLRQARYEAHVGALIRAAGVPAPAVLALIEHERRGGVVYERVNGPSMNQLLEHAPWRVEQLAQIFAATHAALHRVNVAGLPAHREWLTYRAREVDLLPDRVRERALAALARLPDGASLCHGDFHPGNLLLSPTTTSSDRERGGDARATRNARRWQQPLSAFLRVPPRPKSANGEPRGGVMVIDWENATLGDPHADVARTLLLLRHAHLYQPPGFKRVALRAGVTLFAASYLARYCQLTGTARAAIAAWQLPVAAVRLSESMPATEESALLELVQRLAR